MLKRHARYHEEWGVCGVCGFDVPVSKLSFDRKYGWQCTGYPGANCKDSHPDRDDYLAARRFPVGEGSRRSIAPTVLATEGIGTDDIGEQPWLDQLLAED